MFKRTALAIALILFILMTTLSAPALAAPMAEVKIVESSLMCQLI